MWLLTAVMCLTGIGLAIKSEWVVPALVAVVFAFAVVMALRQPIHGLCLLLFGTLVIEQYTITGLDSVTTRIPFFTNLNAMLPLKFFSATPAELLMLAIIAGQIGQVLRRRVKLVTDTRLLTGPTLLMIGVLIYGVLLGEWNGGRFNYALWEVRALAYLCLMILLVPQIVRTRADLGMVVWSIVAGIGIKALQGVWRLATSSGQGGTPIESIVSHEDALFFATALVLLTLWFLYGVRSKPRLWLTLALLPILIAYLGSQRRAGYVALMVGLGIVAFILLCERPRTALKFLLPALVILPVYAAVFWTSDSILAQPVRGIRSAFQPLGERDILSNMYRIAEKTNLTYNIQKHPYDGLGFGVPYEVVAPMDTISFPLWQYITHDAILWVWMKTGMVGFAMFWLFIGSLIVEGLTIARSTGEPDLKTFALFAVVFIAMQMVTSYADMQLTFYRNMIYLGVVSGTMLALRTVANAREMSLVNAHALSDGRRTRATTPAHAR